MPATPAKPVTPEKPANRRRKAKTTDLTMLPEIPCAVHLEFKLTWLGITVTKVTKPLIKP